MTAPILILHPMQLTVGGFLVPLLKKYTEEYPSYASHVPLPKAMRAATEDSERNPSVYSDRTWAILTQAKASQSTRAPSGGQASETDEDAEALESRRFVRSIKIRTALIMLATFLLNRRDAAKMAGL